MRNKAQICFMLLASFSLAVGCSTAPRRERPVDVQPVVQAPPAFAPVSGPTAEEERLRLQLEEERASRARAEADKQALADQLDQALATKKAASKKTSQDSYLK